MLDATEYLHLAIHASGKGDHHAALTYLKEAISLEPNHATARFLLAAEHAELGLFERAIEGMKTALSLAPELDMARFQLGLLYIKLDRKQEAQTCFSELALHTKDEALHAFSEGLQALCEDQQESAKEKLALGLLRSEHNPALKNDMQALLSRLCAKATPTDLADAGAEHGTSFLGAYQHTTRSAH